MDFGREPRINLAPTDRSAATDGEEWPKDIPEYCKGVEVHPDEPYYSLGDNLGKLSLLYRMRIEDLSELPDHNLIKSGLYWLDRSKVFYQSNQNIVQGLLVLQPMLTELLAKMERKQYGDTKELLDRIRAADKSIEKTFQIETGKLTSSVGVALFPLMKIGLNDKVWDVITKPVARDKVVRLLDLIEKNRSGELDNERFKTGVEILFVEELRLLNSV